MAHSYNVAQIPLPPLNQQVTKYASLRLLALTTNPEYFSAKAERERTFSVDQWRERIHNRVTFIATTSPETPVDSALEDDNATWVGLVSLLPPEFFKARWNQLSVEDRTWATWSGSAHTLVSMWVHPDHRRRGVGESLISQALEWVNGKSSDEDDRAIVLDVLKENRGAAVLYRKMGFEDVEEVLPSIWMRKKLV
ncbi:hypothetical protein D9757_008882 [Collybiopsis confluens]|uniref:N-acetyltransferase domain-containing protein n=1 Tax=Collybiopsis confluens TaxID=2823264 RepID=A0A8H5M0K0_9AGAR|nr:hypothetical protein D9757_008882 [Collybiopsis confluens]